ncbi:hypothetical protein C8J56DRAFT_266006 [Mycena floridula]|nr:hypothetical protein C8J56DRAFT_266006 [Mycena floridula]
MAEEMDEFDAVIGSDEEEEEDDEDDEETPEDSTQQILEEGTAIIDRAEVVSLSSSKGSGARSTNPLRMSGTLIAIQPTPPVPFSPVESSSPLLPSFTAVSPDSEVAPSPRRDSIPPPLPPKDRFDTRSIKSKRSMRSMKSTRSNRSLDGSRASIISAARRRSERTSAGSLRLPRGFRAGTFPPLPDLPQAFYDSRPPSSFNKRLVNKASVLSVESPLTSTFAGRKHTSIDSLQLIMQHISEDGTFLSRPQTVMDDIHIMPRRDFDDEIEEVLRTPRRSVDDVSLMANTARIGGQVSQKIPSIWLDFDAPKTPAERVEIMQQQQQYSSKPSSYTRLKSFTKRYSMPFPLLTKARVLSPLVPKGPRRTG